MDGMLHQRACGMNKKAVVPSEQSSDHQQTPIMPTQIAYLGGEATLKIDSSRLGFSGTWHARQQFRLPLWSFNITLCMLNKSGT